jgi:uncharacterized protein
VISTKVVKAKKEEEDAQKFSNILIGKNLLNRTPSHRLLAMLRAENEGFIKVDIDSFRNYRKCNPKKQ